MNCRELSDFLADYVAGDLTPEVSTAFEGHIVGCGQCEAFVAQYRATIQLSASAYEDVPIDTLPDELVNAILASLGKTK